MESRGFRTQSAMEYLMTYGWAILIIAVVLAALFSLNVFNAAAQLGSYCIGQPGWSCSQPSISQNAAVSLTLGQGVGYMVYNAQIGCLSITNSINGGIPLTFNQISSTFVLQPSGTYAVSNQIPNGATLPLTGLQCYPGGTGPPTGSVSPIGSSFTGIIWMSYSTSPTGLPVQDVSVIRFSLKSSS